MFDLSGKIALVTGASGGIGDAVSRTLCAAGATVAATGRNQERLEDLSSEIGTNLVPFSCDLANSKQLSGLVERVTDQVGAPQILVNNAGVTRDNLLLRMRNDEWDAVLQVNLTAAMTLAKGVLKGMMKQRWGRIVSIGSVVGSTGNPGQSNYSAAKAGLIGFSKSLAQEVASRGISVNTVAPGYVETAMTAKLSEAQRQAAMSRIPARRLGHGKDVAAAVLFLCSEEAGYVTGETIHVNGGLAMI